MKGGHSEAEMDIKLSEVFSVPTSLLNVTYSQSLKAIPWKNFSSPISTSFEDTLGAE